MEGTIANLEKARVYACGVATEGKIFIAGGREDCESCLKTYEMHNISTNEWQFIASLNVLREHCRMICLKGTLYVLGGRDIYEYIQLSVECYDPVENKWFEKTTMPVAMTSKDNHDAFTGCVLKLSKGVLDKLNVIKQ